jgi:hypothetical protein
MGDNKHQEVCSALCREVERWFHPCVSFDVALLGENVVAVRLYHLGWCVMQQAFPIEYLYRVRAQANWSQWVELLLRRLVCTWVEGSLWRIDK